MTRDQRDSLLNACAKFIAVDLRPISAICGDGLWCLMAAFATIARAHNEYDVNDLINCLPQRETVRTKIQKCAKDIKRELKQNIMDVFGNKGPGGAFSCDIWTDGYMQKSYICITAHYVDQNFNLHCRTITNRYMSVNKKKDGAYVRSKINKILRENGIQITPKVVFITDRGSNMLAALFDCEHTSCGLHFFCNCLKNVFKEGKLKVILSTSKNIVRFIKKSGKNELFKPSLKSTNEVRFNYALTMFESLLANDNWITMVEIISESQNAHLLQNIQKEELEQLVKFLKIFQRATSAIESTSQPTIHRMLAI